LPIPFAWRAAATPCAAVQSTASLFRRWRPAGLPAPIGHVTLDARFFSSAEMFSLRDRSQWQASFQYSRRFAKLCSVVSNSSNKPPRLIPSDPLADLKRIAPQIVAVQLDEVEGVEKDALVSALVPDEIERGDAVVIAGDSLAIDDAGA